MRGVEEVFDRLSRSAFRQRFRLSAADRAYLDEKGLPTVLERFRFNLVHIRRLRRS
ncbi:DUF4186 family protein [Methylobacterium brachiatum]|uniref:DUF4186 family protein n=1 Tax=Methylobacterium brachiatum TaxID=269660 RepID=UPI0033160E6F